MRSLHTFIHNLHSPDAGLLLIRIAVGVVFLVHGWEKFALIDEVVRSFNEIRLHAFWAYLVAGIEVIGGIAVLLGVFTRYAAGALMAVALIILFKVNLINGFFVANGGYEFALVLALASAALLLSGGGRFSAMHRARLKCGDLLCNTCEVA